MIIVKEQRNSQQKNADTVVYRMQEIYQNKKRPDQYAALNFTQIGEYKLGKHLGAGAYASVK